MMLRSAHSPDSLDHNRKPSMTAYRLARAPRHILSALLLCAIVAPVTVAADSASGSIDYHGRSIRLQYAWLVTGPSDFEAGKTIRRLVVSATDIGARLQACTTFSCTDGEVMEGTTVDFTGGRRLEYWIVMNGQKVQYSGTAQSDTFAARTDEPGRLAGRLAIDDTAAGGPKLDIVFDIPLLKGFDVAR
jgi:hypothetical protein